MKGILNATRKITVGGKIYSQTISVTKDNVNPSAVLLPHNVMYQALVAWVTGMSNLDPTGATVVLDKLALNDMNSDYDASVTIIPKFLITCKNINATSYPETLMLDFPDTNTTLTPATLGTAYDNKLKDLTNTVFGKNNFVVTGIIINC